MTDQFIIRWNNELPLDLWWRRKYNIPFNSQKHREVRYIDIYHEWQEEQMWEEHLKAHAEDMQNVISPDSKVTQEEEEMFDVLDQMVSFDALNDLNTPE